MAHDLDPALALPDSATSDNYDPLATFDDVMAFIDGFLPSPSSSDDAFERSLLASASGSDMEGGDMLLDSFFCASGADDDAPPTTALGTLATSDVKTEIVGQTTLPPASRTPITTTPALSADQRAVATNDVAASKRKRRMPYDTNDAAVATAAPTPTTTTTTNPPPIKEATRKRNAYREKMKREMQYLRARASEMEEQLAALRQGSVTLSAADKQLINSSWKRIAHNQLEARATAEAENARLRSVLQTHMAMSKTLEQSLSERLDATFLIDEHVPKPKRGRLSKLWEDEGFSDLVRDLDDAYNRLGQIMRESALATATGETPRTSQIKTLVLPNGARQPYLEITDTAITPFHPRLTARAVWRSLLHDYLSKCNPAIGAESVWHTGNTIAANCRIKHRLPDAEGRDQYIKAKVVMRKYVDEESRMVLVWRAHNASESGPPDVFVDETGWSVIQAMAGPCGLPDTGSIARFCMHFVEHDASATSPAAQSQTQSPSVGELTNMVVSSNIEELDGLVRAVESILLNEATTGAAAPSAL